MKTRFHIHPKWLAHYKVKIFSILCALFLWFYVVTDNTFEYILDIPFQVSNQPKGWILSQPLPSTAKILFTGAGKSFLSFHYRDRFVEVNLHDIKNQSRIPLTMDMIKGIPSGMKLSPVQIIEPDSITIQLDEFATAKKPIHPNISLVPMDGYTQIGEVRLDPDSVLISGPKSAVFSISSIMSDEKVFNNVFKTIQGKISLKPVKSKVVQLAFNSVRFTADIQRIGERIISEIPISIMNAPPELKVTAIPSTLTLKLQGGVEILQSLSKEEITAVIDYNHRSRYQGKGIPATIKLPRDVSFSEVKPKFFNLVVER